VYERCDASRLRAFDYTSAAKLDANQLLASTTVTMPLQAGEPVDELGRLAGPVSLSPRRYQVRIWCEGERARPGDAVIVLGNDRVVFRAAGPLSNPAII